MESNGFMIGPGIKEIGAIKVVLSTAGHPVVIGFCGKLIIVTTIDPILL